MLLPVARPLGSFLSAVAEVGPFLWKGFFRILAFVWNKSFDFTSNKKLGRTQNLKHTHLFYPSIHSANREERGWEFAPGTELVSRDLPVRCWRRWGGGWRRGKGRRWEISSCFLLTSEGTSLTHKLLMCTSACFRTWHWTPWSVCLFWHHYHTILISVTSQYNLG